MRQINEAGRAIATVVNIIPAEGAVEKYVTVPLNDNQFSALVSFVSDVGVDTFIRSSLIRSLNFGKYDVVGRMMIRYNHIAGEVDNELTRRRFAEAGLWKKPT